MARTPATRTGRRRNSSDDDDLEDEQWYKDWLAREAAEKNALAAFGRQVKQAMADHGAYEVRNQFPSGGRTIIHRSTRRGIAYQVTWVDDQGPSGHSDQRTLDGAIERAWEDVHSDVKRRFRGNPVAKKKAKPKAYRRNPFAVTAHKPKFVTNNADGTRTWSYRGYLIDTHKWGPKSWSAPAYTRSGSTREDRDVAISGPDYLGIEGEGVTEAAALRSAKIGVDYRLLFREAPEDEREQLEDLVSQVSNIVMRQKRPTRSSVAREIETDKAHAGPRRFEAELFDSLPLQERLDLIEEVLESYNIQREMLRANKGKPPRRRWAKGAVKRPGKLGGAGFMSKSLTEQKAILRTCERKYGYRSCLGSVMFLHNITRSASQRATTSKLRIWLVSEYGASPRKNPADGQWHAVPALLVGYDLDAVVLTSTQVVYLTKHTT